MLVNPNPYSGEDLMNYKSLDCYINFVSSWVREVLVRKVNVIAKLAKSCMPRPPSKIMYVCIVILQVNHSQKMSERPLTPWIIAEGNGKLLSAHCNCMAGLGESCSHMVSLLWAVESGVQIRNSMIMTQKKSIGSPTGIKEVLTARGGVLFSDLSSCSSKPAILSLVEPFSSNYILDEIFHFV